MHHHRIVNLRTTGEIKSVLIWRNLVFKLNLLSANDFSNSKSCKLWLSHASHHLTPGCGSTSRANRVGAVLPMVPERLDQGWLLHNEDRGMPISILASPPPGFFLIAVFFNSSDNFQNDGPTRSQSQRPQLNLWDCHGLTDPNMELCFFVFLEVF